MNQEGQQNGNSPIKACKRGHGAPSRNMQIDENQPLAPLPPCAELHHLASFIYFTDEKKTP